MDAAAMAAEDTDLQVRVPKAQAATSRAVALANVPRKVAVLAAATAVALVVTGVAMTVVASAATVTAVAMVAVSEATTVVDTTPPRVPPQAVNLIPCAPAWT